MDILEFLMGEGPAIQNLDFLRQLIAEAREDRPMVDMAKLRMMQGYGMGTDALTVEQGE